MNCDRTLPWDWYPGKIPENVVIDESAYIETTFSFYLFRSRLPGALEIGRGASTYLGTMFDVGPEGRVRLGDYALVHGARVICDAEVTIGDYALISWNVVLMDTYRLPFNALERRRELELLPTRQPRLAGAAVLPRPIRIDRNVWIGFDSVVLPGVTIGEGAVVGARSVVVEDVPPCTVVAGNPARVPHPGKARSSSSASCSGIRWRVSPGNFFIISSDCEGSATIRITSKIPAAGFTIHASMTCLQMLWGTSKRCCRR
jgi:acetyltransferase-like isoleucine patch superfamily enzyme